MTGVQTCALPISASALTHLANVLSRQPAFEPLAAGEIITTGTLTAALPMLPGEEWVSRYEGLPGVSGLALSLTP